MQLPQAAARAGADCPLAVPRVLQVLAVEVLPEEEMAARPTTEPLLAQTDKVQTLQLRAVEEILRAPVREARLHLRLDPAAVPHRRAVMVPAQELARVLGKVRERAREQIRPMAPECSRKSITTDNIADARSLSAVRLATPTLGRNLAVAG